MNKVSFLDVRASYLELKSEIDSGVSEVLNSGRYILGSEVEEFEDEYSNYVNSQFCVAVGSGLSALEIALRAIGINEGDEVIVPSNTFIATWYAVTNVGCTPVPVDPNEGTLLITAEKILEAITTKTRAVIPVHLYGRPCEMDQIIEVCKLKGIKVIEDAAQAHGAYFRDQRIGSLQSDAVCWSFYPGKNLGAFGDAGAITTSSAEIAAQARLISNYGSSRKYVHDLVGTNSRLDPLQARILRIKLKKLDEWNRRREVVAGRYLSEFTNKAIHLPIVSTHTRPSWHLFAVRTKEREHLSMKLSESGIETVIHYPVPPHLQDSYKDFRSLNLPIAEKASEEILSLPIGPHLSEAEVSYVIDTVNSIELARW